MHLTMIANPNGTSVFIGLGKKPTDLLASLQSAASEELRILESHELAAGWDTLAMVLVQRELQSFQNAQGWFAVPRALVDPAFKRAIRATQIPKSKRPKFGDALKSIRTTIFGTSQEVFGAIAGCNASTVSRWEAGTADPSLADIKRLRDFAFAHGLAWNDNAIWQDKEEPLSDVGRTSHIKATA